MIKEFNNESQAKATADSLGLIMTKYKGVYIVSNNKEEILANYGLGYNSGENVFYDKEIFGEDEEGYIIIRDKDIIDASSVELPYNIRDCSYMFWLCASLETPPKIPKGVGVCNSMFYGCTSLKKAPIIPEGVQNCYSMFESCTSLVTPPLLPEGIHYCSYMFSKCTSLKEAPIIPEGVEDCTYMFHCCTSLKTPPIIPESVGDCRGMFKDCTSLKETPRFPVNSNTEGALENTPFKEMRRN